MALLLFDVANSQGDIVKVLSDVDNVYSLGVDSKGMMGRIVATHFDTNNTDGYNQSQN